MPGGCGLILVEEGCDGVVFEAGCDGCVPVGVDSEIEFFALVYFAFFPFLLTAKPITRTKIIRGMIINRRRLGKARGSDPSPLPLKVKEISSISVVISDIFTELLTTFFTSFEYHLVVLMISFSSCDSIL